MTGRYRILPAADRDLDDQAAYLADAGQPGNGPALL